MLLPSIVASLALSCILFSKKVSADDYLYSRKRSLGHIRRNYDEGGNYKITIIHVNDVHSHLDVSPHIRSSSNFD